VVEAFNGALAQIEQSGKNTTPYAIANLAYQIYCQDFPEEEPKPSQSTFHLLISGKKGNAKIQALLDISRYVKKQR